MAEHPKSEPTEVENEAATELPDDSTGTVEPIELESPASANHLLVAAVVFEGGLGLLALALGWACARPVWEEVRWDKRRP